jgi:hypothetical protein
MRTPLSLRRGIEIAARFFRCDDPHADTLTDSGLCSMFLLCSEPDVFASQWSRS